MDYSGLYYKCSRPGLVRHIKKGNNRVLDVGCAEGMLGENLKQQGLANEVIGIELFPEAAKVAEDKLDRVICGDLETMDLNELGFMPQTFDYIICGDVLEHLRDPWGTVSWLVTLLKQDGRIIASVPNVRHWSVLVPLLFRGTWNYQAHGIMDRSHLRFFTKTTAQQMFVDCGLYIESCEGNRLRRKKDKLINLLTIGMGIEFVSVQWILVAKRKADSNE